MCPPLHERACKPAAAYRLFALHCTTFSRRRRHSPNTSVKKRLWQLLPRFDNCTFSFLQRLETSAVINHLLKRPTNSTIHRIQIQDVWRPHVRLDEVDFFTLQSADIAQCFWQWDSRGVATLSNKMSKLARYSLCIGVFVLREACTSVLLKIWKWFISLKVEPRYLKIPVSQSSAASDLKRGEIFYSNFFLQSNSECNSERIIKISPRLPKLSQKHCVVFSTHRAYAIPQLFPTAVAAWLCTVATGPPSCVHAACRKAWRDE